MPNLLVFDVSNIVCRVFHATAASTPDDRVLPFARSRVKKSVAALIREADPLRVVAAFDAPGGSFRNRLHSGYKAHRGDKHPALVALLSEAPKLFADLGAENVFSPDHEADDAVATMAEGCLAVGGWRTIICSNDGDLLGCVHDLGGGNGTFVLRSKDGAYQCWGPNEVENYSKIGVPPQRVGMFKSLSGDASDGLSGVPGIGPVAARRLANRFPNMRRLYAALEDPRAFTKGERAKLEAFGLEEALKMERLTRLVRKAPLAKYAP